MKPIIKVENLSKQYIIGGKQEYYSTFRESLINAVRIPLQVIKRRRKKNGNNNFWALKDLNFEVMPGEVVGIIGRNGAGKSTLLKILSRITEPTKGRVELYGRVGSLLEVGTGFHPELTGRENIFLNGAILGMRREEIAKKFDEIVDFAEIEEFLDTPVKRYSSGMYMRLAFAVAANLEPEILVVDEVLAVGDSSFQKKCLGKMEDVANQGRTVLFVSHNMAAIRKLCNQAILLNEGSIMHQDKTAAVLKTYTDTGINAQQSFKIPPPREANAPAFAHTLTIEDENGIPTTSIPVGKMWQIRVNFTVTRSMNHFVIALGIRTNEEIPLKTSWSKSYSISSGEYEAVFREEVIILGSGRYPLILGLSQNGQTFHYTENAGVLEIAEFSEGIDLVNVTTVGSVLNPMEIQLFEGKKILEPK